jgi:hypothetical protein
MRGEPSGSPLILLHPIAIDPDQIMMYDHALYPSLLSVDTTTPLDLTT